VLSLASLLYVALNVLPSTILFTDLTCGCATDDCMGETSACKISRYTIFILMMIFYSLLTQVVRLASVIDIKHRANHFVRWYAKFGDRINWYMKTSNRISFRDDDCLLKTILVLLLLPRVSHPFFPALLLVDA
jgi:hypothetical protein